MPDRRTGGNEGREADRQIAVLCRIKKSLFLVARPLKKNEARKK